MKFLIEIDKKKALGRRAMTLLKDLAKKENGVKIHHSPIKDLDEDSKMVKRMLRARKSGFIDTEDFLVKLKSQL